MMTIPEDKKMSGKMKAQRGFTLVELMVIVFIFPILILSTYFVLTTANVIFQTNDIYSRLNQNAAQVLRTINMEIGQTSPNIAPTHLNIATDGNNNSIVRFQIPVDWDNDGDADTGGLNPQAEWGTYDLIGQRQGGRLSGWARYTVTNNQLIRDVLDSSLSPVGGLSQVIANNVQQFRVSQNQNALTMNLTMQGTDNIGQNGRSRNFQSTLSTNTILRNAVN